MFENILTKENVTFKDFEEIAYKIACELLLVTHNKNDVLK